MLCHGLDMKGKLPAAGHQLPRKGSRLRSQNTGHTRPNPLRQFTRRGAAALTSAAALIAGGMLAVAPQAVAAPAASQASSGSVANPYSPAYQHPYRHGALPTLQQHAKMKAWAASQKSV